MADYNNPITDQKISNPVDEIYQKDLAKCEDNIKRFEEHIDELKSLDFSVYADKLKVPILVPMGNKILFRGELQHTNEVMVAIGTTYFVKCSIAQAEVLKQHRIKDAQSKLDLLLRGKKFVETRLLFAENSQSDKGKDFFEPYDEDEDKAWREKHKENVKKYKQSKAKEELTPKHEISDTELWARLEELELQEELEMMHSQNNNDITDKGGDINFLQKLHKSFIEENNNQQSKEIVKKNQQQENSGDDKNDSVDIVSNNKDAVTEEITKRELLQKVLEKQDEIENKLHKLKHREREQSKTEQDLIAQLDEMEQIDELEDEVERLNDVLETDEMEIDEDLSDSTENSNKSDTSNLTKCISFADDHDTETLELEFSHTDTEPDTGHYDPEKGILKPSDVYEAYSNLFDYKTTSILKKSKYVLQEEKVNELQEKTVKLPAEQPKKVMFKESMETLERAEPEPISVERTIVIGDVVEKVGVNQHNIKGGARPTSLFKKKRMNRK